VVGGFEGGAGAVSAGFDDRKPTGISFSVTACLWSTVTRYSEIDAIFGETAPVTPALTRRIADLPPLAKAAAKARQGYGDACCGGQIEASLRKVLEV
jgi:glutathione S-transferase